MKFLVSIISKDEKFDLPDDFVLKFRSARPDSRIEKIPNNRENITVVGNRLFETALAGGFDFLVMLHGDVSIDLVQLCEHVERCSKKYDVMGLCGCEKISVSESPLNWFNGSRRHPEGRWGCVSHGELGGRVSFFSAAQPDVADHGVSCIDGLCMVFSRKAMESGLRFDERLAFNCYDTQISLDAILKHGLKVGVLVEKGLRHHSVGLSIVQDDFLRDETVLREKFGFGVPKGSRLENFLASKA